VEALNAVIAEREQVITGLQEGAARLEGELAHAREATRQASEEAAAVMDQLSAVLARPREESAVAALGAASRGTGRSDRIVVAHVGAGAQASPLGEVLVRAGVISAEQLDAALQRQKDAPGRLLGTVLIEHGDATEESIAQAVGCQLGLPYICPNEDTIDTDAIQMIPRDLCMWHVCVPMKVNDERIVLAMANPLDAQGITTIEQNTKRRVAPVVAAPTDILNAIDQFYGRG